MGPKRDLAQYRRKRDFRKTPEPAGWRPERSERRFVVQKHAARRLHYDFRLELGGVLKSWAVTKGPSLDPSVRRLAVHVEDHPVAYADFEGMIPKGEYGAGAVIVWDRGTWIPTGDPERDYERGHLKFRLSGDKLNGGWVLVRMKRRDEQRDNWLLIKERDPFARTGEGDVLLETSGESVLTGRTLDALRQEGRPVPPARRQARRRRARRDASRVAGAKQAPLPPFVEPQLATSRSTVPEADGWHHEVKLDGYRTLARIDGDDVRLLTRNGLDWTVRYGDLPQAFRGLSCRTALIDGEIVVQDARGVASFPALQDALGEGRTDQLLFYAFDLLHLDDFDLRPARLVDRRQVLQQLVEPVVDARSAIQWSESVRGKGKAFFEEACRLGLEGVVSKRSDAPYRAGRSRSWVKVKRIDSDEFRIVGFTESDAAGGLGALLLAEEKGSTLRYVGKVGTGFAVTVRQRLVARLRALRRRKPPLPRPAQLRRERVVWVDPVLTCEVEYRTRTTEGLLRQPSYKALREDRTPPSPGRPTRKRRSRVSEEDLASVWVTNPDRVMFGGPTKLDLALYYARVGDRVLPRLMNRPLSIVRCPTGEEEDCFFQKHASPGMPESVPTVRLREETTRKRADFLYVADAKGLLSLVQFGTVEFHPWSCRLDRPERPDRMVLDLDPGSDVVWRDLVGAAFELREVLRDLGLVAFVKTTGGRGLHVVVPLERRHEWKSVLDFSRRLAVLMAHRDPGRFTAGLAKRERRGRIFVDYLRNARGSTAVGAWSLRARPGAPVALPLDWDELSTVDDPRAFDYATVAERMREGNDPWEEMDASARRLTTAMVRDIERRSRRRGG